MDLSLAKGILYNRTSKSQQPATNDDYWQRFKGLSFEQFWDKIGRPEKPGTTGEIYPYEHLILQALKKHRLIWIKKATGLGITEFFLRWIAWKAINDPTWQGIEDAQVVIVTGQNWETAIGLMRRLKALFHDRTWTEKETVAIINGCRIQTFPSNHLDAARSLKSPKFWMSDEADFFPPGEQENNRTVSERYIAKSNIMIVMISTLTLTATSYYESTYDTPVRGYNIRTFESSLVNEGLSDGLGVYTTQITGLSAGAHTLEVKTWGTHVSAACGTIGSGITCTIEDLGPNEEWAELSFTVS